MSPFTIDDAETTLRLALDAGDAEQIDAAAALVDQLDPARQQVSRSLLASALWYAEQGLHVFPLTSGAKVPFPRSRGFKDATTDHDQIRAWWGKTPDANIGIATGTLVDVVDIDGYAGQASRAQCWDMFEALTVLGVVSTPRPGGMHLYRAAAGHGNRAGLLPSIDYRGHGGYVVAPPSRTEQGTYRWITPLDLSHIRTRVAA